MQKKDLRGRWSQAFIGFFAPLLVVLGVRWLIIEPYVIPSGSMIPTLLIHDHVVVNKLAYGIHWPFSKNWFLQWSSPRRGDVVVFRYPEKPDLFYIKRVAAVAGDEIEVAHGALLVNGQKSDLMEITTEQMDFLTKHFSYDADFAHFNESFVVGAQLRSHIVRYKDISASNFRKIKIPDGQFFAMGDNRDESYDSRFWGTVDERNLIGRAFRIWLACESTLESAPAICDPTRLRWSRLLLPIP